MYALQEFLKKKYDVKVIDYYNSHIQGPYQKFWINKKNIKTICKSIIKNIIFHQKIKERYDSFNIFEKENIIYTNEKVKNKFDLEKIKSDVLIAGSDQIWNHKITGSLLDEYALNIENNSKKISYAASIGNSNNITKNSDLFISKLKKLDAISVREEKSAELLSNILKTKVKCVMDPTLLLSEEEWTDKISNIKKPSEKYIAAYVISADDEYVKIVNSLSEKTGLKVIHFELKNPGYKNVLKSAYTEGPLNFINYIKNAEYVVATSFHATVFSIIFNKKFFIVPHKDTGERVVSLLNKIDISDRAVYTFEEFKKEKYDRSIDYNAVKEKLENQKKESIDWLLDSIER